MNTLHTHGPWSFGGLTTRNGHTLITIKGNGQKNIAKVTWDKHLKRKPPTINDELIANAYLIASAPKLLHALFAISESPKNAKEIADAAIDLAVFKGLGV